MLFIYITIYRKVINVYNDNIYIQHIITLCISYPVYINILAIINYLSLYEMNFINVLKSIITTTVAMYADYRRETMPSPITIFNFILPIYIAHTYLNTEYNIYTLLKHDDYFIIYTLFFFTFILLFGIKMLYIFDELTTNNANERSIYGLVIGISIVYINLFLNFCLNLLTLFNSNIYLYPYPYFLYKGGNNNSRIYISDINNSVYFITIFIIHMRSYIIKPRRIWYSNKQCCICQNNKIITTDFHYPPRHPDKMCIICIEKWREQSDKCPICREDYNYSTNNQNENENENEN